MTICIKAELCMSKRTGTIQVIELGEWSSGMIPRLGCSPNTKFEEARGSIPRLPHSFENPLNRCWLRSVSGCC